MPGNSERNDSGVTGEIVGLPFLAKTLVGVFSCWSRALLYLIAEGGRGDDWTINTSLLSDASLLILSLLEKEDNGLRESEPSESRVLMSLRPPGDFHIQSGSASSSCESEHSIAVFSAAWKSKGVALVVVNIVVEPFWCKNSRSV